MSRVRWVVGKVNGRLKVEFLPIKVKPQAKLGEPWRYRIDVKRGFTYQKILERHMQENANKPLFCLKNVVNVNFVRGQYDSLTYKCPAVSAVEGDSALHSRDISEQVDYLSREVGMTEGAMNMYLGSAPSLLGASVEEVREKVKAMRKAGFTNIEIAMILPSFPHCVMINWCNVHNVFKVLTSDMELNADSVVSILRMHPYIFTYNSFKVSRREMWRSG